MEFRVLGPLEVRANGVALPLGTRKQQIVLAVLAVNANRLVSVAELVDELWSDEPPPSAVANVSGYASKLRRLCGSTEVGQDRILRRGSGYVLSTKTSELDMLAFMADCAAGRAAIRSGDLKTAIARFETARARWCGAAVCGMSRGPVLDPRCTALEDERLAVTDELADLYLIHDQPGRVVTMLREHLRVHPLRERSHALFMRALYRSGDIAGALSAYADARAALVDQLGIEPGRELRELHQAVLTGRDDSGSRVNASIRVAPAAPRPRELPPNVAYFVGRAEEKARARSTIVSPGRPRQHRAPVVVLYGPGGSGKSALAVHLAHEVADGFADGQLYVDLLGSTPGLRPLSTVEVLHRLLRSLGVPDVDIPQDAAEAAARFRTITADRRLLILLDNAHDASQITAFLPTSDMSAVLVTSRRPLVSLEVDRRIRLGGLPTPDGHALLVRLAEHVTVDEADAVRIVELCDHLPPAVRIVAGRLSSFPAVTLHDVAERLADRRRRLDELELDGLAVRSSIGVGYDALAYSESETPRLAAGCSDCSGCSTSRTAKPMWSPRCWVIETWRPRRRHSTIS